LLNAGPHARATHLHLGQQCIVERWVHVVGGGAGLLVGRLAILGGLAIRYEEVAAVCAAEATRDTDTGADREKISSKFLGRARTHAAVNGAVKPPASTSRTPV
jgi:hypothetical protein